MNQSQSKLATYMAIGLAILVLLLSSMKNSKNKNGNALRHDTVLITKIKLQKQEAERQMFLCKSRK